MDTTVLTAVAQAFVQIITILTGVWALFNKQNSALEKKLGSRINNLEHQVKMANQALRQQGATIVPPADQHRPM